MKIIAIASYIVILGIWAYIDASKNNRGKPKLVTNDIASWLIKYILGFLIILYVAYGGDPPYSLETLGMFLMYGACAWAWFDLAYILFRVNVRWNHVGTTAWTDRIFQKFGNPFLAQSLTKRP
jgi:hypothetical protein